MRAVGWAAAAAACGGGQTVCEEVVAGPSDDPADWDDAVDPTVRWVPHVSEPVWTVPSDALPVPTSVSNNNVAVMVTADRWYLAWRTAPVHFADPATLMHVVASEDGGATWTHEHTVSLGTDVREPTFLLWDGVLSLEFFQGGDDPAKFEPRAVWRAERCAAGAWSQAKIDEGTRVPWDRKVRGGVIYRTSYTGEHYGDGLLDLHFESSTDGGHTYAPVGDEPVYRGGNSEAAFEILRDGSLVAVTRNEDGDATGQGAMVCTAPADALGVWDCPDVSDPQRYDSPELLRHGDDVYLLARRDVGGAYGEDGSMLPYSTRPKRTALYQVVGSTVTALFDLPSAGDTAFVSAWRTGPHSWLLANYTSPVETEADLQTSWLEGQVSPRGTAIYLAELTFTPE